MSYTVYNVTEFTHLVLLKLKKFQKLCCYSNPIHDVLPNQVVLLPKHNQTVTIRVWYAFYLKAAPDHVLLGMVI